MIFSRIEDIVFEIAQLLSSATRKPCYSFRRYKRPNGRVGGCRTSGCCAGRKELEDRFFTEIQRQFIGNLQQTLRFRIQRCYAGRRSLHLLASRQFEDGFAIDHSPGQFHHRAAAALFFFLGLPPVLSGEPAGNIDAVMPARTDSF